MNYLNNVPFETKSEFDNYLNINKHKTIIILFYIENCNACSLLKPTLYEKLKHKNVELIELNATKSSSIPNYLRIRRFPTLYLFKHGQALKNMCGIDMKQLNNFLSYV